MNAKLSSTITIVVALIIFSTTVFSQTQEKVLTQAETEAVSNWRHEPSWK